MFKRLVPVLLASILLSGCSLPFFGNNQKAGLQVTSTPQTTVFLDGNSIGLTPILEEDLKPGTYTLRLSPNDSTIPPWETKIELAPGILTVVDRHLSSNVDQSHGYSLSFEKLDQKSSDLAVTTFPDSVTVTINGEPQGFTPLTLDTLSPSDHTVLLTSPGFEDKTVRARTIEGYRLTITAQLAKKNLALVQAATASAELEATPSGTPTPSPSAKTTPKPTPTPTKTASTSSGGSCDATTAPYAEILDTPTGWLRVRSGPASTNEEITKVDSGDKCTYLKTESGWHQITLSDGTKGWISGQYANLVK